MELPMHFKLVSKNAYRDLVRNCRRISISELSDSEKREAFRELYEVLKSRLGETTRTLNAEAAYASRCQHWNQRDLSVLKPVKTVRNPWLRFKREFVNSIHAKDASRRVEIALAWFYHHPYRDDWIPS
jgi:predicted ATPase